MSDVRKNLLAQIRRKAKSYEKITYDISVISKAVAKAVTKLDLLPTTAKNHADFSIELDLTLSELSKTLRTMDKRVIVTARWHDEENITEVKDLRILGIQIKWSNEARGVDIPAEELFTIDRLFLEGWLN